MSLIFVSFDCSVRSIESLSLFFHWGYHMLYVAWSLSAELSQCIRLVQFDLFFFFFWVFLYHFCNPRNRSCLDSQINFCNSLVNLKRMYKLVLM